MVATAALAAWPRQREMHKSDERMKNDENMTKTCQVAQGTLSSEFINAALHRQAASGFVMSL